MQRENSKILISVAEDLTKEEKEKISKLAQEAKNWKENNDSESWRFRIRGIARAH